MEFRKKLEALLNAENKEAGSDTPDFILAEYLDSCLRAFDKAVSRRTKWYEKDVRELKDLGKLKQGKEERNG